MRSILYIAANVNADMAATGSADRRNRKCGEAAIIINADLAARVNADRRNHKCGQAATINADRPQQ